MLGGDRGAVGSRDLAGEEAPGAQQAVVTHLLGSRSCCLRPRQKGLLGHLFSLCLHGGTPGNPLLLLKTPGEEVSEHACFVFCLLFNIPESPPCCLRRRVSACPLLTTVLGQNGDTTEYVRPLWSKVSHLVRSRLGYKYPGPWLQVPE